MKNRNHIVILILLCSIFSGCNAQTNNDKNAVHNNPNAKKVAGTCEGCELMYVAMPEHIGASDTTAGWIEKGQKLLITGKVYKPDSKTPAPDVVIYYWHTDSKGNYSPRAGMEEKAKRHGYLRGWIKTDKDGKYAIYTSRPASYPDANIPAHIHLIVKEPTLDNEYYISDFLFDDDKFLTPKDRQSSDRGGNGVLKPIVSGELQIATHDIFLGLNVPGYPK